MSNILTTDEALSYLGIDYADAMVTQNIARTINTADSYLKGAIGENYPTEDPRAKELALIVVADLYENRGIHDSVSGNVRKLVADFSMQLRLEMRRSGE